MKTNRLLNSMLSKMEVYCGTTQEFLPLKNCLSDMIIGNQRKGNDPIAQVIKIGSPGYYGGDTVHRKALKYLTGPECTGENYELGRLPYRLHQLRVWCSVDRQTMAKVIGITPKELDFLEDTKSNEAYMIPVIYLCRIAAFYGVSLSTLLLNCARFCGKYSD